MKITARQLMAIEKSIGFDAKVSMITESESYRYGVSIEARFFIEGEPYISSMFVEDRSYAPFSYIATTVVQRAQREIQDYYFRQAFFRGE